MNPLARLLPALSAALLVSSFGMPTTAADESASFTIVPEKVTLQRNFDRVQLLVTEKLASGRAADSAGDLTRDVSYATSNAKVVSVDENGQLVAVGNGEATIQVSANNESVTVPVTVNDVVDAPPIEFVRDVTPILSKAGCNMGACHATQYGQAGFKLSVFGFEPGQDRSAIVRDRQQRRINPVEPARSLFLLKPTMQVPHGGGKRLATGSIDHQTLVAWLAGGAPGPKSGHAAVAGLAVFPKQRVGKKGLTQQIRVEATYADGSIRDVTALARYDSMDEAMIDVSDSGFVTVQDSGQAPVMVRFEGQAGICMFVAPYADQVELAGWKNNNFVDEHAVRKFQELGIEPSPLCDDGTFIRRAFLDATGTLPTAEQTRKFLASKAPDKRDQLIDELLGLTGDPERDIHNDDYAAWWTLRWSDLIRNTSNGNSVEQAMWAMHNWMKDSFRTNRTFDKVVRELVTAKGSIYSNGPANYFRIFRSSTDLTEATAQLFLGVRLECAKCHHHPFEKYSQDDYYGFGAFFARVGTKNSQEFGLFGRESIVIVRSSGEVSNPRSGKRMAPTPLEGEPTEHPLDRRIALADWLTQKDNTYFARNIVNRYVSYLLGRGLVEPVDDLRSTNPPTNPALMDALSKHFVDSGFDLKQLIRAIMVSRLYQLDYRPTDRNHRDTRFYSRFGVKRMTAEALLDAVDQVTGSRTKFRNLPSGTRAIELPDAEYPNYFLNVFAKPRRASVCECERTPDQNLVQTLHILNGEILTAKLSDANGRVATLVKAKKSHEEIVTELYLAALSRHPLPEELTIAEELVTASENQQTGYEDVLWTLITSKHFIFVH